jgi:hypothetical protein
MIYRRVVTSLILAKELLEFSWMEILSVFLLSVYTASFVTLNASTNTEPRCTFNAISQFDLLELGLLET